MSKESPTLKDVAQLAGVSIDTARRALENHPSTRRNLKKLVDAAAAELGYRPNLMARALRDKSLWLVPVSISEMNTPYFADLAEALARELTGRRLAPVVCHSHEHLRSLCQAFPARVCILANGLGEETVSEFAARQKVVTLNSGLPERDGVYDVAIDFAPAYDALCEKLAAEGRRRYCIYSPLTARAREHGWRLPKHLVIRAAAAAHGLSPLRDDPDANAAVSLNDLAGMTAGAGGDLAVFCENDSVAARAATALLMAGKRLPRDLRLVGCDGTLLLPGVWTLRLDTEKMAAAAVQAAQDLFSETIAGGRLALRPALVLDDMAARTMEMPIPENAIRACPKAI